MDTNISIFITGIALLVLSGEFATAADTTPLQMVKFGYSGDNGPERWGTLSTEYRACGRGKMQSPINLNKSEAIWNTKLDELDREYVSSSATLFENGYVVGLIWNESVGYMSTMGKNYTLKQCIWHVPSEHHVNGVQYPAELQLMHQSDDGTTAVVSILYQYGDPDPFLLLVEQDLEKLADEACNTDQEARISVGNLSTKSLRRRTRKYFKYAGSLTTPPCTERVIWFILGKIRKISREQVALLKSPLGLEFQNNARPVQPMNGRRLHFYNADGLSHPHP